jgi:L-lactate utilization protein LutB
MMTYHLGDEVYWSDPDDGACSGIGKFLEYKNEEIALIEKDGVSVEVYVEELA